MASRACPGRFRTSAPLDYAEPTRPERSPVHRIDPVSLQLFLAVVREGSIKRAAETEHIAQSALSRRMGDLEHSLGVPLLSRSPMGVQLTEAGERAHALG